MQKKQAIKCMALLCACALMADVPAAYAAAREREMLLLMDIPVVVTASKTEQLITEAPATIEVITAQEIRDRGLRTLGDALRTIAGIDVASMIYTVYISPRGLNDRRSNTSVLFLIDGHPYTEITRGTSDPLWVPLSNVKRIEVIKGPGSALYGANAFSGVVNIITKTIDDMKTTDVRVGGGTYGTFFQELNAGFTSGGIETVISAWHYYTDAVAGNTINNNDTRDDYKAFIKVKLPNNLILTADHYNCFLGLPGTTNASTPNNRGTIDHSFLGAEYSRSLSDKSGLKILASLLRTDQEVNDSLFGIMTANSLQTGAEVQFTSRIADTISTIFGAEVKNDKNDSNITNGNKTILTKAVFLQGEARPNDMFIITAGGRYDMPDAFNNVLSPRANITWKINERATAKASYGEAFRAPNFFDLYASSVFFNNNRYRFNGNPDLQPERINTKELGGSYIFGPDAQASINLFDVNTSNTMTYDSRFTFVPQINNVVIDLKYINKSRAEITGGECSFKYRFSPSFETTLGYSWQYAKDLDLDRELSLAPRQKVNLMLSARLGEHLKLNTWSNYVDGMIDSYGLTTFEKTDPYTIHNVRLIWSPKETIDVGLTAYNLMGGGYYELQALPLQGRTLLADITLKF